MCSLHECCFIIKGPDVTYREFVGALIQKGPLEFVTDADDFLQAFKRIFGGKKTEDSTMVGQYCVIQSAIPHIEVVYAC